MFTENKDFVQDAANFEFAVTAVNRLRPAFVVITGDLVHKPGDAAQIAEYRRIAGKIDAAIPVYHIAGNHDVKNVPTPESLADYIKIFGPDRYTFSHRSVTGIVLNSSVIHSPQDAPQHLAEQERWLRAELTRAKPPARPTSSSSNITRGSSPARRSPTSISISACAACRLHGVVS